MVKISYGAKIKSRVLSDFGGAENEFFEKAEAKMEKDEEVVVSIEGKERIGMAEVALTAFESYYGCKPDRIVLTRKEELEWKKHLIRW